jgi:hypothetical protein
MLYLRRSGRRHYFKVNFDGPLLHPTIEGLSLRSLLKGVIVEARAEHMDVCQ